MTRWNPIFQCHVAEHPRLQLLIVSSHPCFLSQPYCGMAVVLQQPPSGSIDFAINPAGQVTGVFYDDIGCHAFLATPQQGQTSSDTAARVARRSWPLSNSLHKFGKGGLARLLSQR